VVWLCGGDVSLILPDVQFGMISHVKLGAFSNMEIPTIPKYTVSRFRSRMDLAKQRLHFCVPLQVEGVCSELCSETLVQANLFIALLLWRLATHSFCCVLAVTTFETMTNTYCI